MQVVILAGGKGTRLRPITSKIPKPMVPVLGKPFLQYQIELLVRNNLKEVILCVGYRAEAIRDYFSDGSGCGVSITYSEDGATAKGDAGALKKAEPLLDDEFFVLNCDSYLPIDFHKPLKRFREREFEALMVVYKNRNRYDESNVEVRGGRVVRYAQGEPNMMFIDYGLRIFRKLVLEYIPCDVFYTIGDLYSQLIRRDELGAYEVNTRFYDGGSFAGLKDFEEYIKNHSDATVHG